MASLTIHRGTHQIGGCCTEIACDGGRILIDFGANLPDSDAPIRDDELVEKVFGSRRDGVVLFTHYHGDHYGLFKKAPDVPMYIGPLAKDILRVLTPYIDRNEEKKGLSIVDGMNTYEAGVWMTPAPGIEVLPLYVDHSALDSYMFLIKTGGKTILFTGDFRDHGILGECERLYRTLGKFVPKGIDILITEGTMLSRTGEIADSLAKSERALGKEAAKLFRKHKYNFVLVSSTNLDSIMEFYHNTPPKMHFVCDAYQAEVILTAMCGMERKLKGYYPQYRCSANRSVLRVLGHEDKRWDTLRQLGASLEKPMEILTITPNELYRDGFVMLSRKNAHGGSLNYFEIMRDKFYPVDGQIIYSKWGGYLKPEHADKDLIDFIGGRPIEQLHTSGHAYVETIARLIETVQPKWIVPMHTERADEFVSIPAFAPYRDLVKVLKDGESWDLDAAAASPPFPKYP